MNLLLEFLWLIVIIIYSYVEALVKLFIPVKRKSVRGEIVLITGAAHGIGRLTAYEFAKHQSKLVLWDLNKKGLEETAEGCKQLGAEVHAFRVDCSVKEEIYSAAEKVKREIGDVSILVNNAGVVAAADFLSTLDKQIEKMFQVNILAHHWLRYNGLNIANVAVINENRNQIMPDTLFLNKEYGTVKAFLPAMVENNHGHIVTVASAGGHVTVPFLVSYCSSKFAAVGFHKSLSQELSVLGKDGIKTSCLCPVFINTGFIKHPSSRILPVLEPDRVAKKLMDGILCNQKMIFLPPSLTTALLLERILPERVLLAVDKIINVKFEAILGCERKEQ